jgi:hypothetical protein
MTSKRVEFYVTANTDEERASWTGILAQVISCHVGGCTVLNAKGYYNSDNGDLITEASNLILAYADNPSALVNGLYPTFSTYIVECNQECGLYVLEDEPHIVTRDEAIAFLNLIQSEYHRSESN